MMLAYTDLFLDFDDTLYDTHGSANQSLRELFAEYRWERFFPSVEAFVEPYWRENVALWAQYAKGEITRDVLIVERFRRPLSLGHGLEVTVPLCLEVSDRFLQLCAVKPGTIPGAHELMTYLRSRGYRLHLCSNGFHEVQYSKLRASDMLKYFDSIILSEDAGANKPSAQFFDYAFAQTNAKRGSTLMIGDNPDTDILGAYLAGLKTIYFNPSRQPLAHPNSVSYEVAELKDIMRIL